jgi:hypothetical protein
MNNAKSSLRETVEHWLAPRPDRGLRVTEFKNRRSEHQCYVCVETLTATGPVALFFLALLKIVWVMRLTRHAG